MKNLFLVLIVVFSGLNLACSKKVDPVDVAKPTFKVLNYDKEVNISKGAGSLNFEIEFTDDVNLGSFKVSVHDNFDGHNHGGRKEGKVLTFEKTYPLSGKVFTVKDKISVPADTEIGAYHLEIMFFDAAGNEGEESDLDVKITK